MKYIFIFFVVFLSRGARSAEEKNTEPSGVKIIKVPQRTLSTGIIVHKRSVSFIDIEAPVNRVWVTCFSEIADNPQVFLSVYIADTNIYYHFFYRRPLIKKDCQKDREDYLTMMKGAKTVRLVGTLDLRDEVNLQPMKYRGAPRSFTNKATKLMSYLVRMQTGAKCKAYFAEDCDLPKNYWAGTYPLE